MQKQLKLAGQHGVAALQLQTHISHDLLAKPLAN